MIHQILTWVLLFLPADSAGVVTHANFRSTVGFQPVQAHAAGDLGVAETYQPDWDARRFDPEMARRWEDLPAMVEADLSASFDSMRIFARLPLRRDIDAWQRDPTGSNLVVSPEEIDINVPYEGWISWESAGGSRLRIGRFRQTFSPSPYGVILGSNLVHDGALVHLPLGRWSFDWFFSSLNPWLTGIRSDRSIDSGSEAALQRGRTIDNERGRNYDEPYKSLFLHRLSCVIGTWEVSAVEQLLVGGKAPELRDAVPFTLWHDNFGDGYSKISTAIQVVWNPPGAGKFHAQGILEDLASPIGEVKGIDDPRTVYAANLGWQGSRTVASGDWSSSVDLTITSASFNNHDLPLLKGTSRRLYRSNNRIQGEPNFVDTWIVDQPLGYQRGSDAVDLWTHLDWTSPNGARGAGLELDWLNQGDDAVWKDNRLLVHRKGPLSGEVTTQWRALGHGWMMLAKTIRLNGGLGLVVVDAPSGNGSNVTANPDVSGSLSVGF